MRTIADATTLARVRSAEARSLGVRYWYRGAKLRLGLQSNYAFGRLIEPENSWFNEDTGTRTFSNKYAAYDKGKRSPWTSLIDKVDAVQLGNRTASGSKSDAEHPVFAILARAAPSEREIRRWLKWFHANFPALVSASKRRHPRPPGDWLSQFYDFRWESLDDELPLDALALATLVAEQARLLEKPHIAFFAELSVRAALQRLAPDLQQRGLWQDFLSFYERVLHIRSEFRLPR
jgi:hypothetical protein